MSESPGRTVESMCADMQHRPWPAADLAKNLTCLCGEFKYEARPVQRVGLDESVDPSRWAEEFIEHVTANPAIATDHATMTAWFNKALATGVRSVRLGL